MNIEKTAICVIAIIALSTLYALATASYASDTNGSLKEQVLSDPSSIKKGEKQFNSTCVYCHGNRGSGGRARSLQDRDFEPDYLFRTITEGKKGGMPPWGEALSEKTRWQLVSYILSLSDNAN